MSRPAIASSTALDGLFPGSPNLRGVVADTGTRWEDFQHALTPRYGRAWADIAGCYLAIVVGAGLHATLAAGARPAVAVAAVPVAALWIGYWIAALVNFVHEAAHFNLHRDKRINDRLADWLLCPFGGTEIRHYREVHWQHHLHLGDLEDTEVAYRAAPDASFVLGSLFGLYALRAVRRRRRPTSDTRRGGDVLGLVRSAALHGGVVVALVACGLWSTALAWTTAVGMIYPLCNTLRQTLEHRSFDADASVDYARVPHGPVNRMFAPGPFARSFGSAGFDRHLLHHWHPTASYTCFDELEAFLMRTPLAARVDAARTTYGDAWRRLARRS